MLINNAKIFRNGHFETGSIEFSNTIRGFAPGPGVDVEGAYVVPGFIDVHTHGAAGLDASDCAAEEIPALSRYYCSHGVTSFCFTTMTIPEAALVQVMNNIRGFERPMDGARCAGVHLEGPFLSYKKRGAQAAENLRLPDIDMFHRLNELSGGKIRLITVAPELEGMTDFIREASKVCTVSLGHSTADFDTAMAGFAAGARAELICDGIHIHPAVILAVHKMFGERLVIISDSLRCAGLTDGHYDLAGQPIVVKDGKATLLDGTIAGSSTNLLDELKNVVSYGMPLEAAVTAMTEAPARAIRMFDTIGSLDVGKCADLLVLDEGLNLKAVFIDGELACGSLE